MMTNKEKDYYKNLFLLDDPRHNKTVLEFEKFLDDVLTECKTESNDTNKILAIIAKRLLCIQLDIETLGKRITDK